MESYGISKAQKRTNPVLPLKNSLEDGGLQGLLEKFN